MTLTVPKSLKIEHNELHKDLVKLTKINGKVGIAALNVAEALHKHFEAEEKYAMPPLGTLVNIMKGRKIKESQQVIKVAELVEKYLPLMLKEHKKIGKKLDILKKIAKKEKSVEALEFAKKLRLHAQNEEEVLYPTTILIGKYLRTLS